MTAVTLLGGATMLGRLVLGTTLVIAGVGKWGHQVYSSPVLLAPDSAVLQWALALERALPSIELVIGLALVVNRGLLAAASMAGVLAVVFAAAAVMWPDGIPCNCFGIIGGFGARWLRFSVALGMLVCAGAVLARAVRGPGMPAAGSCRPTSLRPEP